MEEQKKKEAEDRLSDLKSKIKECKIQLHDCFESELFKNLSIKRNRRVKLTTEIKQNLNLIPHTTDIEVITVKDAVPNQQLKNSTLDSFILKPSNSSNSRQRNDKRKRKPSSVSTLPVKMEIDALTDLTSVDAITDLTSVDTITDLTSGNGSFSKKFKKKSNTINTENDENTFTIKPVRFF